MSAVSGIAKVVAALAAGAALSGAIVLGATRDRPPSAPPSQIVAATPTPFVEVTPTVAPGGLPEDRFDPARSRTDCPEGWSAYTDPDGRFSVCYPPNVKAFSSRSQSPGLGILFTVSEPQVPDKIENRFVIHMAWSDHSSFVSGKQSEAKCASDTATITQSTRADFVEKPIDSRLWSGCRWEGRNGQLSHSGQLRLDIPFLRDGKTDDGYVRVTVNYLGPDYAATFERAQQVIDTIRLP